jgi:hypothetical protein
MPDSVLEYVPKNASEGVKASRPTAPERPTSSRVAGASSWDVCHHSVSSPLVKIVLFSVLALILLAVAGAIGYEIGIHHAHPATTHAATTNSDLNGVFANGSTGTPHYYVSVREGGRGKVKGTVNYLYQDGQTQPVLTFTGTAQDGVATLKPTIVLGTGSATATQVPPVISMTYGNGTVGLGECTTYLHFVQTDAGCTFSRASGNG